MNEQSRFRLFDLPGELVENIGFFFFSTHEAHKLLTVSPAFHSLFSRRVWRWLYPRVFTLSKSTRSMAFARYGKLVRYIDLYAIRSAIKSDINNGASIHSILSAFSDITTLRIGDNHKLLISNGIQYKDIIMCFPKLCKLCCRIEDDNEPYDLVTLALAINYRQNSYNMNHIEHLNLRYDVKYIDNQWTRLSSFVQMVLSNSVKNIRIIPRFTAPIPPSQSELQFLCKYLVEIPFIASHGDSQLCYTNLNHSLFWKRFDVHSSCVYAQLRHLSLNICCMSSITYDYSEITARNFPRLQSIYVTGHVCDDMVLHSYSPAWEMVLLQTWPHLNWLRLTINMTYEQLMAVLEYNRRLTTLVIELQPKMMDKSNLFNLAIVLPKLRKLKELYIIGKNETKIDYSPTYDDLDILAQSQINYISFTSIELSSRICKLLYSLPKIDKLLIHWCKFYSVGITEVTNAVSVIDDQMEIDRIDDDDENDDDDDDDTYAELMAMLNSISAMVPSNNPCSVRQLDLHISSDDNDWPIDFTLEMVALMPKLRIVNFKGEADDIPRAVKARFPCLQVKYLQQQVRL
ncbi:hypothetical protein GQ42DRAFT_50041 [Ramicandelaber brevisporus]|nr:hypothetical protein GQ42DRAFT_50041 [Ramicandelaber brevisporus]